MSEAGTIIVGILCTGAVGVIAWSLVSVIQHGKQITALETTFGHIQIDMQEIKDQIKSISDRMDSFLNREWRN